MARKPTPAPRSGEDRLSLYRAKRDFSGTPEPAGAAATAARQLIVQHHFATRDHYDLRLEIDGVLASWAVTRGPSANPRDKRLAVRTEDHPLDYAAFEGAIPKGHYGAGAVILWESTTYTPLNGDPAQALRNGEIKFLAHGARMRGAWVLVRMKTQEKRENWLLIKERDGFAEDDDGLTARFPGSIATQRSRVEIEAGAPAHKKRRAAKSQPPPAFVEPQLCETAQEPPATSGWLTEMKYDGYRLQIARGGEQIAIYTRTGLDWTKRFPGLASAARALPCDSALLDGEAVVFDRRGVSDFPGLVAALESGRVSAVEYVAFDLLFLDGADLRALPLQERKGRLQKLLGAQQGALRFADNVTDNGAAVFAAAAKAGAEGVVCKRAASAYRSGRWSDWLKVKSDLREDVLAIGYMPSTKNDLFASLLAAVERDGELVYVGRIGTGYDAQTRRNLWDKMANDAARAPPQLANPELTPPKAVFLKQPLRVQTRFGGWTGDGQMRQARFLGLREDLPAYATPAARAKQKEAAMPKDALITHRERIVYTADGFTKGDIADYYASVADKILPYLADRPVSIVRAPENIDKETFFQRRPLKGMTRGVTPLGEGEDAYFALDGREGLMTAAQFGAIEFHGWMSRADRPGHPDRMIFDLDPDASLPFETVKTAAQEIASHLQEIGLVTFAMLTGGKGVHVVAPLDASLPVEDVEMFAHGFALGLAQQAPERFIATMSKTRREGRIFIDWMRNKKIATAILPWSLRARPGAPAAVPVTWKELQSLGSGAAFNIETAPTRADPWKNYFTIKQTIPRAALDFMRKSKT
ncbi:MAG: DNA ligase D [Hyphomicrobiales bacterium]|nr:DNA ligase D [Hyphomicrobiales bacterium]